MGASSVSDNVGLGGDKTREELVGLGPSVSSDGVLDLLGHDHRGVNLQVDESAFVGNEDGRTAI